MRCDTKSVDDPKNLDLLKYTIGRKYCKTPIFYASAVGISGASEHPYTLHFWKGHKKLHRIRGLKFFLPRGWGRKIFKVLHVAYRFKGVN